MRLVHIPESVNKQYSDFTKESEKLLDLVNELRFSFSTIESARPMKDEHQVKKRD